MKTLELFFNNEEESSIYESWCFEPHSQEKKNLGNLYIIAKLKGRDSTSLDYLASGISDAYSRKGSLEAAIKLTKRKIKERGLIKLEIAILSIKGKKLTFTKTDGIKVALLRDREVVNIGSKVKGELNNIGVVDLEAEDKIMAITSEAWRKFRQKHLISKIASYSKEKKIRTTLTNDVPGVALITILNSSSVHNFRNFFGSLVQKIKRRVPHPSKPEPNTFLSKRINATWPDRKAQKAPFLIASSYLLSFITIRLLVFIAGSVNSPVAQTVKESSSIFHFHIGRNIILFGYHIHHFYFGIILMAIAGWLAITDSSKLSKWWYAVMYGAGLGLLMDEIGLLLTWGNYTSSLSYLLGVLLLGVLLNIVYFPSFWKKVRSEVVKRNFGLSWLNKLLEVIVRMADKVTGRK